MTPDNPIHDNDHRESRRAADDDPAWTPRYRGGRRIRTDDEPRRDEVEER